MAAPICDFGAFFDILICTDRDHRLYL